jgi:hypothetical protein
MVDPKPRPTAVLIVTTLDQVGAARVTMTDDVDSAMEETRYVGSLAELGETVSAWWRRHWTDGNNE